MLGKTFGTRLVSVILYGSAARGEYVNELSDLNILCVLQRITVAELKDAEPIFHWWRKKGNPSPLLMSEEEVRQSTDCFPIEFHDMKESRRVLTGLDVIDPLVVDDSFYRAQVEHELRAKLLRLRQKAGGVMFDQDLLCRLMTDALSTFVVLFRHSLRLCGHPGPLTAPAVIDEAERKLGIESKPFLALLALRANKIRPKDVDAVDLLEGCIAQIAKVTEKVDSVAK